MERLYITLKNDSPHNIHTVCRRSCYTSASKQLPTQNILATSEETNAFEFHRLSANNSSWRKRELCGMEKVTFICPIKIRAGLAKQGFSAALPFPHVEQDSAGCLPKEQLNTNLEDPDPLLPKHISTITACRSCQRYFQTKVKCIPSSWKPW